VSREDSSGRAHAPSREKSFWEYLNGPHASMPPWVFAIGIGVFFLAAGGAIIFVVLLGILGDTGSARLLFGVMLMGIGAALTLAGFLGRRRRPR
jgi:hypothetical protein